MDKIWCWFHNAIVYPLSCRYYRRKKAVYRCIVCGKLEAPYFRTSRCRSLPYDYGWHRLRDNKKRWICHHCADHTHDSLSWDRWQAIVKESNNALLKTIQEKDPVFFRDWRIHGA